MANDTTAAVAVIGMAGKYPRAYSPAQLWEQIASGTEVIEKGESSVPGLVPRYNYIKDPDLFDNEFFGYTPNDVALMDPQHRLLLICAYRALEDAGYERTPDSARVGVYASSGFNGYLPHVILPTIQHTAGNINYSVLIGNEKDFLATKIAYKLNLKGPAISIQCACSSSLVALHYACQSLLNGDCDIAMVCAVSLSIPQSGGYIYKEGGPLSPDGLCRPFDKEANGTVPGDACSVVVLKRLRDSLSDNDRIYALVSGTAVNNDGSDKIGFTAPSITGQRTVIEEALSYAGISPKEIDYLEAHGTGTVLGDRIELTALSRVFANRHVRLPVGSIKSNIGHTDVAAGLTSVIKAIFMLRSGTIPAIANLRQHDYDASGADRGFDFPTERRTLRLQHIGVSSFGIGGTNSHAIVSRYPSPPESRRFRLSYYLVPVFLNKISDLPQYRESILRTLKTGVDFLDFAATMAVGRRKRAITLCFVARDKDDFVRQLSRVDPTGGHPNVRALDLSTDELIRLRDQLPSFAVYLRQQPPGSRLAKSGFETAFLDYLAHLKVTGTTQNITFSVSVPEDSDSDTELESAVLPDDPLGNRPKTPSPEGGPLKKVLEYISDVLIVSDLDLSFLYSGTSWKRIALPAYPLNEKRFWFGNDAKRPLETQPVSVEPTSVHNQADVLAVLAHVLRIWADAVGYDDLSPDATYAESGGDSLAVIGIVEALQKDYGINVTARELLSNLTPRQIAARIAGGGEELLAGCASYIRKSSDSSAGTVFLLHPAGGSTFCYGAMNRFLSADCTICAIDLPENYKPYTTLERLAEYYLDVICDQRPSGPYCLGGYSFGGNIAYEIAGQMQHRGLDVGPVFMFDSHPPEAYWEPEPSEIDYEPIFSKVIFEYPDFSPLLSRARPLDIKDFCERWTFCFRLLKSYRPCHIVYSDIYLFACKKQERQDIMRELNMRNLDKSVWQRYFGKDMHIVPVDGDHYSMFGKSFHLRSLARQFESLILKPATLS